MSDHSPLFAGAAQYYAKYRPKYPQSVFDFLTERFKLDRSSRVLDLGCGTGNASLPLASVVGEIVGMDPDPDMIAVAAEQAQQNGIQNVTWLNAGSRDLSPDLGTFRLVCMGQSFHWMDRNQVLNDLYPMVEIAGGIALLGPGHGVVFVGDGPPGPQESWEATARDVMKVYDIDRRRHPRSNPEEPRHEHAILRSRFQIGEYHEFESELPMTPDDVVGRLYSFSGNLRERLGDRVAAFEHDLRAAILALHPSGMFTERLRTGVLVAVKRTSPATRPAL